jgi:predicted phosphodiesterase
MAHQPQCTPLLRKTRIVCISDTHTQTPKLPKGDVLIHAGDLTNQGSYSELKKIAEWLEKADFEAKIVVAGTYDSLSTCLIGLELTEVRKPRYHA